MIKRYYIYIYLLLIFSFSLFYSNPLLYSKSKNIDLNKCGIVDYDRVYYEYYKTKIAITKLQKVRNVMMDQVKSRKNEIKLLFQDLLKQSSKLDLQSIKKIYFEIILKKDNLNKIIYSYNEKIKELNNEIKKLIMEDIQQAINIVQSEYKLEIIYDKKDILSFHPRLDFTEAVLGVLNRPLLKEEHN